MDYRDGKPREIEVSIFHQGAFVPCGQIVFNAALGIGGFTYHVAYAGPVLDPVHLDYRAGRRHFPVEGGAPDMLHRVFVDYMPGPWGLKVLQAEHPEIKEMSAAEKLHWFGSRTVGSLAFSIREPADEQPVKGIDLLEQIRRRSVDLFASKIGAIELGRPVMDGLSAHGGARPKCIFEDRAGNQWLCKFNSSYDPYNYARVEHATSLLARRCGIHAVPRQST